MGSKKKAAEHGLSKKERKALEERAATLAAELAEREKAAKKKAKGKGPKKLKKKLDADRAKRKVEHIPEPTAKEVKAAEKAARKAGTAEPSATGIEGEAIAAAKAERARLRDVAALVAERAKPLKGDALKAAMTADTDAGKARKAEDDASIKARVAKKREAREALATEATAIDRGDEAAVREYNERAVKLDATLLTSNAEKAKVKARGESSHPDKGGLVTDAESHVEAGTMEAAEGSLATPSVEQVAEVVETEEGREFAVGAVPEEEFARPSEAPKRLEDNTNGNGQYKIVAPDGKERGYTRATTYIDCLDDRSMLEKWKARIILEGVAALEEGGTDPVTSKVRDLAHVRDVTIAKARKADKKGKLGIGQLEAITSLAWSTFKRALDEIADQAFEVGGGREKAAKGTDIHELCALAVEDGIDAVGDKLTAGEITPADLADVVAFLDALEAMGAKVLGIERVIVVDDLKVGGRLDYILMVKLPGMTRATRVVADLKTGAIEYSIGKIARQLSMYANGEGYDESNPSTAREDLKLSRTKALLFHLPAGSATVKVYVVDLTLGAKGNRLAADVRSFRNEGKRAVDLKADVLTMPAPEASE